MKPYKRMSKGALALVVAGALATGGALSIGAQAFAQEASTSPATAPQTQSQSGQKGAKGRSHAALGSDGTVTGISGTTITMAEEADEGGGTYTVDASNTTFMKNGAGAQLSDIKAGDKIFVKGTVNGTNVAATAVYSGKKGGRHAARPGQDGNVTAINGNMITMQEEANEGGASYTVDASSATVTKNGAASSVSSIAVGDKIFVKGTVNGTNVTATSISDGHHKGRFGRNNPAAR